VFSLPILGRSRRFVSFLARVLIIHLLSQKSIGLLQQRVRSHLLNRVISNKKIVSGMEKIIEHESGVIV
jgi:hypothetical protein